MVVQFRFGVFLLVMAAGLVGAEEMRVRQEPADVWSAMDRSLLDLGMPGATGGREIGGYFLPMISVAEIKGLDQAWVSSLQRDSGGSCLVERKSTIVYRDGLVRCSIRLTCGADAGPIERLFLQRFDVRRYQTESPSALLLTLFRRAMVLIENGAPDDVVVVAIADADLALRQFRPSGAPELVDALDASLKYIRARKTEPAEVLVRLVEIGSR